MKNYDTKTVEFCGCEIYELNNGRFHRLDGPAIHDVGNCCQGDSFFINGAIVLPKDYDNHPEVVKFNNLQKLKEKLGV